MIIMNTHFYDMIIKGTSDWAFFTSTINAELNLHLFYNLHIAKMEP